MSAVVAAMARNAQAAAGNVVGLSPTMLQYLASLPAAATALDEEQFGALGAAAMTAAAAVHNGVGSDGRGASAKTALATPGGSGGGGRRRVSVVPPALQSSPSRVQLPQIIQLPEAVHQSRKQQLQTQQQLLELATEVPLGAAFGVATAVVDGNSGSVDGVGGTSLDIPSGRREGAVCGSNDRYELATLPGPELGNRGDEEMELEANCDVGGAPATAKGPN